jgi:hypothetical protein
MWMMVSGSYRAGAASAEARAGNLAELNRAARALFRAGHGVNLALPLIEAAAEAAFDEIMMPLSLSLVERSDACLRVGGPAQGADLDAGRFRASGRPVYARLEEAPVAR